MSNKNNLLTLRQIIYCLIIIRFKSTSIFMISNLLIQLIEFYIYFIFMQILQNTIIYNIVQIFEFLICS